jgi:hypothetical protein
MRILYCTPESPNSPNGNLGIYLRFVLDAMSAAGHEVFVFTWRHGNKPPEHGDSPFPPSRLRAIEFDPAEVEKMYPAGPWKTALTHLLSPYIAQCVDDWNIEIVESSDRSFPAYAFFQSARTTFRYRHLVLATSMSGLNVHTYRENLAFPDRVTSDDLCSGRQMLRLSDVVIAPSRRAEIVARQLGVETPLEIVPPPFNFIQKRSSESFSGRLLNYGDINLANGIDAVAFLANQISGDVALKEIYLIGEDAGTHLHLEMATDLFAARLKPAAPLVQVATGALSRVDALDLVHSDDLICAFGQIEAFSYFPLEALDRGAFPLAFAGSALAEHFPADMADCLLPTDLSKRNQALTVCDNILSKKAEKTSGLQHYIGERSSPKAFAARMEAVYGPLATAKGAESHRFQASRRASPTIAVLVAAYNPDSSFEETLDCVARQTRRPDNLIFCNDGSTTDFSRWIDYASVRGLPPKVLRQRNQGLSGARNTLIDASDADLSLFLDCDDLLSDNALERMLEAWLAADRPDAVIPQRKNFGESTEVVIRQLLNDHLHFLRNEYRMTALIKTSVLRDIRFDAMRRNGEADDWIFWLEFSARNLRAEFVPENLLHYCFKSGSMSWPWSMGQAAGTAAMIAEVVSKAPPSLRSSQILGWSLYEFEGSVQDASRP